MVLGWAGKTMGIGESMNTSINPFRVFVSSTFSALCRVARIYSLNMMDCMILECFSAMGICWMTASIIVLPVT